MCSFTVPQLRKLASVLALPETLYADNGSREDRVTALAMLCARLAWPLRLADIQRGLGWEQTRVSRFVDVTAYQIVTTWSHILRFDPVRLRPTTLRRYADRLVDEGCPLTNCWGFIDGTLRHVARPDWNQSIVYNGWKRFHALKFHSLVTPDGIISHVFGPVEGRRHDETLLSLSGLEELLAKYSRDTDETSDMVIFGDSGYSLSRYIICPFSSIEITPEQAAWNHDMSSVRQSVEWTFAHIINLWAMLDFPRSNKLLQNAVGLHYLAAILLTNAHSIFNPNQTSQRFRCAPPDLGEYFREASEEDSEMWEVGKILDMPIWDCWDEVEPQETD